MTSFPFILKATALALLVAAGLAWHAPAYAGEQPNLLVVGEDADEDTVPRNSRVFNRVLGALAAEMVQLGFKVYDETAVAMDINPPNRIRRSDAELITVAQRVQQPPIDAIVVFQIYASVQQNPYADIMDLMIRIPGRMIHVQSGQMLGGFEVAFGPKDLPPLPPRCNRDCVLEHIGTQAKQIAHDLGAVLAQKLSMLSPARGSGMPTVTEPAPIAGQPAEGVPPQVARGNDCTGLTTGYTLVFRGFESPEILQVERYLVAFKGYDHHRPVRTQGRYAEYWYETCADVARLDRNIQLMLEQMALMGRTALRGNRIEVDKISQPMTR